MKKIAALAISAILFLVAVFPLTASNLPQETVPTTPTPTVSETFPDIVGNLPEQTGDLIEGDSPSPVLETVFPLRPFINAIFLPIVLKQADGRQGNNPSFVLETREEGMLILGEPLQTEAENKPPKAFENYVESDKEIPPDPGLELLPTPSDEIKSESEATPLAVVAGWNAITTEGFEGAFPNSAWSTFDNNGTTYGEYYWDDDDYKPYSGGWSAWVANGGANLLDPQYYYYPNNLHSWMVYGPFDLSNAADAELLFYYWNQSELNYDYFGWYASTNGTNFYGYRVSGDSAGWRYVNFDLTAVPGFGNLVGDSSVWIAFIFTSDGSLVDDGAFVDNIVLQKYTNAVSCPNQYKAEYYNNRYLSGNPTFVRCENWPINQNWGNGGPGNGVGVDNFSARWTGTAYINAGTYTFVAVADDGIKVWLDGTVIVDGWRDQAPTEYRVTRNVNSGNHTIKVEYYENGGGAVAQFRWEAPTVSASSAWTADSSGNARTVFNAGNSMRYYGDVYNGTGQTVSAYLVFSRSGPCGTVTLWSGNLNIAPGIARWYLSNTAPRGCPGNYTYNFSVTYNGRTTSKSSSFTTNGIQGIDYHTRDGFQVFKIDMWSSNLSFETVMARDASSGNTTNVEWVTEMVARSPYASRNPVLAFNADYFGENHHGAEGLTVKNGTRLPNAGTNNGCEWRRSSLSITSSKGLRIGRQTDCQGPPDTNCTNWVPDRNAYYNTLGGGPLFVNNGQRIGGNASTQPCTSENLSTTYCTGSFNWTAAGMSQDGRYLIVIVSGSAKTMDQAASVLIAEGAWRAMKLDGGGSTQVWYKPNGSLVNGSRRITNALLVFSAP